MVQKHGAETVQENSAEKWHNKEKEILDLIKKDNRITRNAIATQLSIGTTTVFRYIETLKKQGIIERVGGDKGGYWKITK